MDQRNLIHPMTAGDLVESACVLAIRERGMGAETETGLLEVVAVDPSSVGGRLQVTFRNRMDGDLVSIPLKADTPLLVTGISL